MSVSEQYETPWRPAYELWAGAGWFLTTAAILLLGRRYSIPEHAVLIAAAFTVIAMAVRLWQGYQAASTTNRAADGSITFIKQGELKKKMEKAKGEMAWVGKGFSYGVAEANRTYQLLEKGPENVLGKAVAKAPYAYWVHACGREGELYAPLADDIGHKLILGATRTGKTRMLDLLITQAILRGESVIVIDPKGDHELRENMREAYRKAGKEELFSMFHPAYPDQSVRLDPLSNWNRSTEIASRIAALIPSETGADPFTAFGWQALNNIVNGLLTVHDKPNLLKLKRYIENGPEDLLIRAMSKHFQRHIDDWEKKVSPYARQSRDTCDGYIRFYFEQAIQVAQSPELEGLISSHKHNREHFQKMVASLIPILGMLTSGPLRDLLSPSPDANDDRPILDLAKVIRTGGGLYVGLDTLSDSTVGSALGSILLADMTAVTGSRYNYGIDNKRVHLIVDETAEVINDPLIQVLNKGGGANVAVTLAMQTVADLAARLGNKDKAMKVLGNLNTVFSLRVQDPETAEFFTNKLPEVEISSLERTYRHGATEKNPLNFTGHYMESLKKDKALLVPPSLMQKLPPLHYFAVFPSGRVVKGRIPILVR